MSQTHSQTTPHVHSTTPSQQATLVVGASSQPWRYAFQAMHMLREYDHQVYAYGKHAGTVAGVDILTGRDDIPAEAIDTVTLYVNPIRQGDLYDWILSLKPRRVIFNPGSENRAFMETLRENGIEPVMACTLVMLRTGQY